MVARWRLAELGLLVFPLGFLAVGLALLRLVSQVAADPTLAQTGWGPALLYAVAVLAMHGFLVWRWPAADQLLLPLAATLAALGLLMVGRLEPSLFGRQAIWILVGAAAVVGVLTLLPTVEW